MRIVKGSWKVPIGKTWWAKTVLHDFNSGSPHIKVAGVTGSGKSVALMSMLYYLCRQQSPKHLEIHIVDLKGGMTFAQFELLPHVFKVYSTTEETLIALAYCEQEMWRRIEEVRQARKQFKKDPTFKKIVLLLDEAGELSPADAIGEEKKLREACMDILSTLARVGREPGIRIIYGTQRPDRYTLPMTVRSQLENSLCFRVSEAYDSRIVLGHDGAESIPKYAGRMLYKTPNGEIPVQGVFVPQNVLQAWLSRYADLPFDTTGTVIDEVETKLQSAREFATNKVATSGGIADTSSYEELSDVWGG